MEIFIEKKNKTIKVNLEKEKKIIEILNDLKIPNSSVILLKNENIVIEDEIVKNDDKLKILTVESAG